MKDISLQQFVQCDSDKTKFMTKLNCKYWSYNKNGDCSPYCELKNKITNLNECIKCIERVPFIETKPAKHIFQNPAQQMKEKLPQYNYYSKQNIEKAITEEKIKEMVFMDKAKSYTKAEASQLLRGKVSEEVYNKRKELCLACPQKTNHTPQTESIGWCTSCGCSSKNVRAALSNKLWMPNLECPLKKFGKEEGTGFNTTDAIDSVKGAVQAIGSLFKKDDDNGQENKKENTQ